ncbi:cupredoxin domain-containing protein [Enterovirga rhinocerotis]|uniref:Putative cupredoxin-like copper-binding protein n=1 Tax=Enterovirga rhinocerotis TaxID=1339210 RepID=A0A4R7CBM4_9HYPH|nr:plastocyanin/azurin family copper-binding protein [Enterovirga rhinocerotis]TDR94157.1 putative cupredoxin-like copper-binding protein [Enterovirga rhinocerotis]
MLRTIVSAALVACTIAASPALAQSGARKAPRPAQQDFAAGQPGTPREPAILLTVTMQETYDGRMLFAPDQITVKLGQQVKFQLPNLGQLEHQFVIGSVEENARARAQGVSGKMANGTTVAPATTGDLLWRFTKPGQFEFGSLLPGQYEAGMKGTITVE